MKVEYRASANVSLYRKYTVRGRMSIFMKLCDNLKKNTEHFEDKEINKSCKIERWRAKDRDKRCIKKLAGKYDVF